MLLCVEHQVTCNKVVDDCIGALIGVHSSGYVPHNGSRRGVLRHCKLLVRQPTTLGKYYIKTHLHDLLRTDATFMMYS